MHNQERIRTFVAGAVASILATLISQPFEVLKINQQLNVFKRNISKDISLLERIKYTKFLTAVRKIYKKAGLRGFWKGHTTTQLLGILHGVTLFSTYEENRRILSKTYLKQHKHKIIYISAFISGSCSVLLFSPIDFVNIRKIANVQTKKRNSILVDMKKIIKKEGFFGLYRGSLINWLFVANLVGLKFYTYNWLCEYFNVQRSHRYNKDLNGYILVGCGALSGISSSILMFPLEVIKGQIQRRKSVKDKTKGKVCFKIRTCAKQVFMNAGLKGFYKGLLPSMLKSTVVNATVFSCYDTVSYLLQSTIFRK